MNPNETSESNIHYAVDAMRGEPEFDQARLDVIKAEVANRRYRENEIKWMDIVTRERRKRENLRALLLECKEQLRQIGLFPDLQNRIEKELNIEAWICSGAPKRLPCGCVGECDPYAHDTAWDWDDKPDRPPKYENEVDRPPRYENEVEGEEDLVFG